MMNRHLLVVRSIMYKKTKTQPTKTSEWTAGRLVNPEVNPVTEAAIKKDSKLKRKYVMEVLLKWKGHVRGGPTQRDTSSNDSTNFSGESEDEW
jgi:hypothetical protein